MKKLYLLACILATNLTAKAQCIESLPYHEDFEGAAWVLPASTLGPGSVDACWNRSNTTTYYWRPNSGPTSLNNTGPSADHTTGTGKYLHAEINGSSSSLTTSIATNWVDLSGTTTPKIRFYEHIFGFNLVGIRLEVQTFGSSTWTALATTVGAQSASSDAWSMSTQNLTSYAGDTVRFRFVAIRLNTFSNFVHAAIDDIDVWDGTCSTPNSFSLQSKTQNSATFNWFSTNTNGAVLRYVQVGQPMSSATIVNAGTTKPYTITGLSPSTSYRVWVRDSCGVGSVSPWIGPITITTNCGSIMAPWSEDFEGSDFVSPTAFNDPGVIHPCWIRSPSSGGYMFITGPPAFTSFNTGPSSGHNGSSGWGQASRVGAVSNSSGSIRTPKIDLSGLTSPELTFWYHSYGATIDRLEIDVATPGGGGWQNIKVITGQVQTSSTQPWEEEAISLSTFANQEVFVRFTAFHNGNFTQANIAIDDISIDEAPPCPRPNPFQIVSVSDIDVNLSWTSGGTAPWQIEYGPSGFTLGSGTLVSATTNPTTIGSLTPNTTYDFYIRDTCGVLGVSNWTGPLEVQTKCSAVSAPFVENFDGTTFSPGTFNVQGTFDPCWNENPLVTGFFWTPSPPPFNNFQTGPASDHTSGAGNYIYTDGQFSTTNTDSAVLESPLVDLSPLTTPELTFWYHMYGSTIGEMAVDIDDGSGWTRAWSITGQQQTVKTDPWTEVVIDLTSYANSTIQVRFVGKRATGVFGTAYRMAIDDFDIHEQPACPKPTQLAVSARTTSSISLTWNGGSQTNWVVEHGPAGFPLGTGTTSAVSGTASTTIGGLIAGTVYQFYVWTDCGTNGGSDTVGPISASTVCATLLAPFTEDFEGAQWEVPSTGFPPLGEISPCWTRTDTVGFAWVPQNIDTWPTTSGPAGDHTTGSGTYMVTDLFATSPDNSSLVSPSIDLTPLDTPQISFFYFAYGSDISHLTLEVKGSSGSWSNVWTQNGQFQTSSTANWEEVVIDLSTYANQVVQFRWNGKRTTAFFNIEIAIDDIIVDEKPQCPAPTNISATPMGQDAIQVSWTSGGANKWQIEYGPQGFIPGTGTFVTTVSNPVIINGLNSGTPYEFYVRDSCSAGSFSWSDGPAFATTYPCANACLYELTLTDQFTNGWIAGGGGVLHYLDVKVAGTTTSYTLLNGQTSRTFDVPVCDGQSVELVFRNNGFSSGQCGVQFKDPSGTVLFTKAVGGLDWPSGTKYTGTGSCTPVCADPVGLTVQSITPTTGVAFWSSVSGSSNVAYGPAGFTLGSPTVYANTVGSEVMTNLTPNASYDVYVQDSCTNGLLSSWVGPFTFTTLGCGTVIATYTHTTNGLQASFDGTGTSSNAIIHHWDFGDGTTGSGANTGHTYATSGIYTVKLVASNACGDSGVFQTPVVVCGFPTAAFSTATQGLDVTVDGTGSTGIGFTYNWDFGDGNNGTGANALHTYAAAGTYDITLIATDTCGSSDTIMQTVTVCDVPVAGYTYTVSGFDVTFDASASTGAVDYFWNFGDGNSGTGLNVSHTYLVNQIFTVTLTVVNACGDSVQVSQIIALCVTPQASWTYSIISSGGSGMLVQFDATASTGTTFDWNFGDGQTATGTNFPTHTYITPGLFYKVTLIVGNPCGETDTLAYKLSQIGIEEESQFNVSIYPNPSDGLLLIDPNGVKLTSYRLISLQGQVLLESNVETEEIIRLELPSNCVNGVYLLELQTDNGVVTERVILRR